MSNHLSHISEDDLQTSVLALFRAYNWLCAHFHDSRKQVRGRGGEYHLIGDNDAKGFPDTVATHRDVQETLFMELKREGIWPEPEQVVWLETLPKCKAFLIWPQDLDWLEGKASMRPKHGCICWWCSGRRKTYFEKLDRSRTRRRSPRMQAAIEQARAVNQALSPNYEER